LTPVPHAVLRMPSTSAQSATEPAEALRRAVQALEDGPADPRTMEGAKVNALESIAWSLVGLLGSRVREGGAPAAHGGKDSLHGEIRTILGVDEPSR
jgi:hypothetical protein